MSVSVGTTRRHMVVLLIDIRTHIVELRKLAWAGIPNDLRPVAWQLLLVRLYPPSPCVPHSLMPNMCMIGLPDPAFPIPIRHSRPQTR